MLLHSCIILLFIACNGSTEKKNDVPVVKGDTANDSSSKQSENIKEVSATFTKVDSKISAAMDSLISKYLKIKNALANNNSDDAKVAGKEMLQALSGIDKSAFTPEERKAYGSEEDDLKENAEHIGESKIDHQRMHFSILSQSMYVIARSFGSGKTLYHFFCQKAENNEGAMWLSDSMDSANPYLGKGNECNELLEKIK
jgi:hypothetical protein